MDGLVNLIAGDVDIIAKQNAAWAIAFNTDDKLSDVQFKLRKYINPLYESLKLCDIELSMALMQILGNYFEYDFDASQKQENERAINQIVESMNDVDTLPYGLYAISKAIESEDFFQYEV